MVGSAAMKIFGIPDVAATVVVGLVALEHLYFLVLEMFLFQTSYGLKTFRTTAEAAKIMAPLAANQGLYNGFLAAGLAWGLAGGGRPIETFFLCCVVVAGIFGAITVNRRIVVLQSVPAVVALGLLWL
jgi:putative membrane protein